MDFQTCLQMFETQIQAYTGDDPLDLWDRYVVWAEGSFPLEEKRNIPCLLERLVRSFVGDKRYCNDERYLKYCIQFAETIDKPLEFFEYLHSQGIGCRSAALHVIWAHQLEAMGDIHNASTMYHRALQSNAQPKDLLDQHYRAFQIRLTQKASAERAHPVQPLRDSQIVNQMKPASDLNPVSLAKCQNSAEIHTPVVKPEGPGIKEESKVHNWVTISKSAVVPQPTASSTEIKQVAMYCKDKMICGDSEMSLEEFRARIYWRKCEQRRKMQQREEEEKKYSKVKEEAALQEQMLKQRMEQLSSLLNVQGTNKPSPEPNTALMPTSSTVVAPVGLHTTAPNMDRPDTVSVTGTPAEVTFPPVLQPSPEMSIAQHDPSPALHQLPSLEASVHASRGPSMSIAQHNPSPALHQLPSLEASVHASRGPSMSIAQHNPSPALHQLPSLEASVHASRGRSMSIAQHNPSPSPALHQLPSLEMSVHASGRPSMSIAQHNPPPALHQLSSLEASVHARRGAGMGGLHQHTTLVTSDGGISAKPTSILDRSAPLFSDFQKPMVQNTSAYIVKQSGTREVSTAANSSGCLANTSHVTPNTSLGYVQATPSKVLPSPTVNTKEALGFIMDVFQTSALANHDDDGNDFENTDSNKLEVLCQNDNNAPALTSAFTIFEDNTAKLHGPAKVKPVEVKNFGERSALRPSLKYDEVKAAESLVDDCTVWAGRCNKTLAPSPNSTGDFALAARLASTPASSKLPEPTWQVLEDKENAMTVDTDSAFHTGLDNSEDKTLQPSKLRKLSPIQEQSPEHSKLAASDPSVPSCSILPAKPVDVVMDEVENAGTRLAACKLSDTLQATVLSIEDPWGVTTQPFSLGDEKEPEIETPEQVIIKNAWDDDLIAHLLSELPTPLNALSNYHEWPANVPPFRIKAEIRLGSQTFCVEQLLGQGAFAQVYQAYITGTGAHQNLKFILKVQKPAKPWEFYIGTQISQRISPELKHLYIGFQSAHIFRNGSVLVGDLYSFGSLLNAINLYKKLSEKVMPVPLVMYFAINILYMVEQLHNIGIIHGDIKPDNFTLGENLMNNDSCVLDLVSHGLALIDLGQSIDMTLLPKGAAFTSKCETSGFQCVEMLTNKPWSYQTDYFGIAGTVYCMLFGNYMKVREQGGEWKTEGNFRRIISGDLWMNFFQTLLNVPDCHSPSPLRALREMLTSTFQMLFANKIKPLRNRLMILLIENKPSRK
ncbi:mitotic checkpoint serine/threonine-protein kinase BUB1 isoform X2 [Hyperolius riggenbachi]|uniref:mitotic checkpoint serine/threonine-protein kinase BUB1 isoform X2 n=1 Tax=Hyperolius riggenbachi TaxID=752182 RepID=UPI0035A3595F